MSWRAGSLISVWHVLQDASPPEMRVVLQLRPDGSSATLQPLAAPHLSCPGNATVGHLQQASRSRLQC